MRGKKPLVEIYDPFEKKEIFGYINQEILWDELPINGWKEDLMVKSWQP